VAYFSYFLRFIDVVNCNCLEKEENFIGFVRRVFQSNPSLIGEICSGFPCIDWSDYYIPWQQKSKPSCPSYNGIHAGHDLRALHLRRKPLTE
jgi:hypothetical protein